MSQFKLTLIVAVILSPTVFGFAKMQKLINPLHQLCLKPFSTRLTPELTHELGSALICGKNLPPGPLRQIFSDLGLYHVLVVSGAHLTWITAIIMFLFSKRPRLSYILLILFGLMTGLQAPILRALIELSLRCLRLPSWLNQLGAVIGCLIYQPQWLHSRSLFLSALARQSLQSNSGVLRNAAQVQLLLLPLLMDFYLPTIQSVFFAGLLSLLIEIFLFPILLCIAFFPELTPVSELFLEVFISFLKELTPLITPAQFPLEKWKIWPPAGYWLFTFIVLSHLEIRRNRIWFFRERSE